MAAMPSHHQNWERPTLVRLAAGASSDKNNSISEIGAGPDDYGPPS